MSAVEQIFARDGGRFATAPGPRETLAELGARAAKIAADVVYANAAAWESASPRELERVGGVAQAVANRLLHAPAARITSLGDSDVGHARTAFVRYLFGFDAALTRPAAEAD